jgi:hypothetical protein
MGKGGKKGRITGSQRKEINDRTVTAAMDGDMEDIVFGRVLKHLGSGNVRIVLPNSKEGIAKIRTVLSKRGSTPIVADDVVVLSGRDFETRVTEAKEDTVQRYDLLGVLTRSQASKLEKDGRIPSWFLSFEEGKEEGGEIFDYSGVETDEDVDIENI